MNLVPALLGDYIEKRRFEESKQLGVMDCIECGSCTYTCPAKRRLVTRVKYAKQVLREEKK
jgi:electron transport complex protein RnfC